MFQASFSLYDEFANKAVKLNSAIKYDLQSLHTLDLEVYNEADEQFCILWHDVITSENLLNRA